MQPTQDMIITNLKPINKNSLICTFEVKVVKWGNFFIRDICFFKKGEQKWLGFPSKQYEKDGEKKYFAYNGFESKETNEAFQRKVIAILEPMLPKETQLPLFPDQNQQNDGIPF